MNLSGDGFNTERQTAVPVMAQSSGQERELNERSLLTTESASNAVVKVFRVFADQSPHECSPQVRRCRDDVTTMEVVCRVSRRLHVCGPETLHCTFWGQAG